MSLPFEVLSRIFVHLVERCPSSTLQTRCVCKEWKAVFDGLVHCHGIFTELGYHRGWGYISGWAWVWSVKSDTTYTDASSVLPWFNGLGVDDNSDLNPVLMSFSDSAEIYGSPNRPYGFLRSDKYGYKYFVSHERVVPWCDANDYFIWNVGGDGLVFCAYNKVCTLKMDSSDVARFETIPETLDEDEITPLPCHKGVHVKNGETDIIIHPDGVFKRDAYDLKVCIDVTEDQFTFLTREGVVRWAGGFKELTPIPELHGVNVEVLGKEISTSSYSADGWRIKRMYTYDYVTNTVDLINEGKVHRLCSDEFNILRPSINTFYDEFQLFGGFILKEEEEFEWYDYDTSVVTVGWIETNGRGIPSLKRIKVYK